ncbi:unnamed protein product, partial [Polarella glacialis]
MAPTKLLCVPESRRDILEYCGGNRQVDAARCQNHGGQGPNIEVTKNGQKTRIVTGIMTLKKMKASIEEDVGDVEGVHLVVAQLRFEARREEAAKAKMARMGEAFQLLGGDENSLDDDDSDSDSDSNSNSSSDSDTDTDSDSGSDSDSNSKSNSNSSSNSKSNNNNLNSNNSNNKKNSNPELGEFIESLENIRPPNCDPDGSFQEDIEKQMQKVTEECLARHRLRKIKKEQKKSQK